MVTKYIFNHLTSIRWVGKLSRMSMFFLLVGICTIAFLLTFFNGFQLAWDDTWQVLENPLVQDYSTHTILFHFTHFWQQQYSPVNSLFYCIIVWLFGIEPAAFHTACLFIHLANTILVFEITKKLVLQLLPHEPNSKTIGYAFFTALIFAIHPLQVESVAWISASKILLYAFFAFLAFGYGLYAVIMVGLGKTITGWASVVASVVFLCGVQLIVLGVIGEYIGKIYQEVTQRPNYLVSKTNISIPSNFRLEARHNLNSTERRPAMT